MSLVSTMVGDLLLVEVSGADVGGRQQLHEVS
jgi:hypothetical protein